MNDLAESEWGKIVGAGRALSAHGWAPAGAGNYSHRRADGTIAITVSGAHKATLGADDVMTIDLDGRPLDARRPSAEAPLHLAIYRAFPRILAVLHTHSIAAVVISRVISRQAALRLTGYELLKAFPGVETHDCAIEIPLFDNSQDMTALAGEVGSAMTDRSPPAFLIRDHGLYGWGASMDEALCVIEAAETMIACELELMRMPRETLP